jgi:hypothetical protein
MLGKSRPGYCRLNTLGHVWARLGQVSLGSVRLIYDILRQVMPG